MEVKGYRQTPSCEGGTFTGNVQLTGSLYLKRPISDYGYENPHTRFSSNFRNAFDDRGPSGSRARLCCTLHNEFDVRSKHVSLL